MTRPLRRAHLGIWVVLAVLLYAVWIAGLAARHSNTPRNQSLRWEQLR